MARLLLRFDDAATVAAWRAIDDAVMGGRSASRLAFVADHAVWSGIVSLAQGGGFASVRSPAGDYAAAGACGYVVTARGDGRRYGLRLFTGEGLDGTGYQAEFTPPAGAWAEVAIPLAAFRARFRGRVLDDAPPLDPARVRELGFMIGERQAGPFALALRALRVLDATPAP